MKDRIYQHENRFLMKDIDGMDPKEITLERLKGNVTQEGTPLNKATLLSDEAANMLGLESLDPTPDDAFRKIASSLMTDYAIGQVATQANYTASYVTIGLTEITSGGSGIEFNGGIFTIKDSRIKAVRIMAGGRYAPADGASTYVGYNRVMKNSEQALYEAVGYCSGGGSAMWSITGIVPVALNDTFTLQGKGSVSGKVGRAVGTNMSVEAIY